MQELALCNVYIFFKHVTTNFYEQTITKFYLLLIIGRIGWYNTDSVDNLQNGPDGTPK